MALLPVRGFFFGRREGVSLSAGILTEGFDRSPKDLLIQGQIEKVEEIKSNVEKYCSFLSVVWKNRS